jgi:hypothetical protein
VVGTLALIYLGGWLPVTLAAYAASKRLADKRAPAPRPFFVSLIAGGLWPLLLVGMIELSTVIVYMKRQPKPARGVGIFA